MSEPTVQAKASKQHVFVPGVKLFSERLCKRCYRPVFHACHNVRGKREVKGNDNEQSN